MRQKKIAVIAKAAKLSETTVRAMAGLPFIGPVTEASMQELRSAFHDLPDGPEKDACGQEWKKLSLEFLRKTKRIDKIHAAYMVCYREEAVEAAYLQKWRQVFNSLLKGGAKNFKQAYLAYEHYPVPYNETDKFRAWQRMVELAATSKEAAQLWQVSSRYREPNTPECQLAEDRWVVLASQEVDQAKNSSELTALINDLGAPSFLDRALRKAEYKLNNFIVDEVAAAETFTEIERLYKLPAAQHLRHELFKKTKKQLQVFLQTDHGLDELAKTFLFTSIFGKKIAEETGISLEAEREIMANRMLALAEMLACLYDLRHVLRHNKTFQEKWLKAAWAELNSAKMPKELLEIVKKSPDDAELKMEIVKKIVGY